MPALSNDNNVKAYVDHTNIIPHYYLRNDCLPNLNLYIPKTAKIEISNYI